MKLRKAVSFLLAVLMTLTAAAFTFGAHAADEQKLVIPFDKLQKGVVDHYDDMATLMIVNDPEKGEVFKIAPNPDTERGGALYIDAFTMKKLGVDVTKYKFLVFEYKLHVDTDEKIVPVVKMMGKNEFTATVSFDASEPLVRDEWATAVFNIKEAANKLVDPSYGIVDHIHYLPFGSKLTVQTMKETDYVLIGDWKFTSVNPQGEKEYNVTFSGGDPKAVGTAPASMKAMSESTITLPAIPYTCEGKIADGWLPSTGTKIYGEGSEFVMPAADVTFSVNWKEPYVGEDLIVVDFADYIEGICDKKKTAELEIGADYEGRRVVKVTPIRDSEDSEKAINLDGWNYGGVKINADFYNTLVTIYKYESKSPVEAKQRLGALKKDTLKSSSYMYSMDPLVANRWTTACYSLDDAKTRTLPGVDPIIKQFHFFVLGSDTKAADLDPDDRVYVYKMLATPIVAVASGYHESFIKGYDDGTFGVMGNMTRAEACTIVARLVAGGDDLVPTGLTSAFSDVTAGDWFQKYVAYCESLDYLKSYSGIFLPNQNITRAEFVELVYNMGLLSNNGKNGTFTDVASDHPRYNVITAAGKAGLVNGYDNGDGTFSFKPDNTINRAEVVKVINNAYGKKCNADGAFESAKNLFSDVDASHWAYADIIDAAVGHVCVTDENGKEIWIYPLDEAEAGEDFEPDYAAGEAFAKATEAKIDARRAEILNTPSDYKEATGNIWYVSNNGADTNDGTSEQTPVATIQRAHQLAKKGDAILFERGGMWRGSWAIKEGVVYSAYGTGPKPIMNGNVEGNATGADNWTLVAGTTNIYQYKNTLTDVGSIYYNDGEKVVEKLWPTVKNRELMLDDKVFDPKTSFAKNDTFISAYRAIAADGSNLTRAIADVYVRCDEGNPGAIYSSIEFATRNHTLSGGASNFIIDNLCIKYAGQHGIGSLGNGANMVIRNCEIAYIGGALHKYNTNGTLTRFGNGIEVYGSCDGYTIDNCYVHQCYDAGITHQMSDGTDNILEKDVVYTNNLIEKCIYNIEYFMGKPDSDTTSRLMQNVLIKDNILSKSGTGWGANPSRSASIKGWDSYNRAENFLVEGNIFFMDFKNACDLGARNAAWMPKFKNNTYCQYYGHTLTKIGANGSTQYDHLGATPEKLAKLLGEEGATFYYIKAN